MLKFDFLSQQVPLSDFRNAHYWLANQPFFVQCYPDDHKHPVIETPLWSDEWLPPSHFGHTSRRFEKGLKALRLL